jgi:hypothetical protein
MVPAVQSSNVHVIRYGALLSGCLGLVSVEGCSCRRRLCIRTVQEDSVTAIFESTGQAAYSIWTIYVTTLYHMTNTFGGKLVSAALCDAGGLACQLTKGRIPHATIQMRVQLNLGKLLTKTRGCIHGWKRMGTAKLRP